MIRAVPLLIALSIASPTVGQDRDAPPPDRQAVGRLRGRVVAADSGRPLVRAEVSVTSPDAGKPVAFGSTDVSGSFDLSLPPGRYLVVASMSGAFLDTQYGQSHPDLPGMIVSIRPGEETSIDIAMVRAGVIAGRVFDEAGNPLPNVAIMALRQQSPTGRIVGSAMYLRAGVKVEIKGEASRAISNDRGEYRVFGLRPGDYVLAGTILGNRGEKRRPATIYFPGVPHPGEAQRFQIGPGQEILNADFVVRFVPTVTISGMAVGPDDVVLTSGSVRLHVPGDEGLGGLAQGAMIKKDGTFQLEAMPGHYILRARHPQRGARANRGRMRAICPWLSRSPSATPISRISCCS